MEGKELEKDMSLNVDEDHFAVHYKTQHHCQNLNGWQQEQDASFLGQCREDFAMAFN